MNSPDIAIIGMAIRCPGAAGLSEYWDNLVNARESISFFAADEIEPSAFLPTDPADPAFVPAAGIVPGHDLFDAPFFGISKGEAEAMDPQHRVFLECVWEAMEDSGHDLTRHPGNVAVYAGSASNTYLLSVVSRGGSSPMRSYQGLVGTDKDYLATRVSYKLNLAGESITVQTACSTSLVAVHLACQSLLDGQSEVAIAGGVSLQAYQKTGYMYHQDAIFSPDGHCRAFDRDARGTVFSNGVGVVVLKRLADAQDDGDRVYAVIKGTAVNNDASAKVSYTAPSVAAQAGVIVDALEFAGVPADTIGYVEAHGTGTALGDPIEVEALTLAFRQQTERNQFCAVGSVKTNIGHLNTAAGVAGLIKAALIVHHGQIPPSLNYQAPNPEINFASTPFFVSTRLQPWPGPGPRRAGVSSFGIGGTNAHAILEQAAVRDAVPREADRPRHLLALSARSGAALQALATRHHDELRARPDVAIADYCFTANAGRRHFSHRLAITAGSQPELRDALARYADSGPRPGSPSDGIAPPVRPRVAFVFSGQLTQYPGMGHQLYATSATFRSALDACQTVLSGELEHPLTRYLTPGDPVAASLADTRVAQPVLFSVGYALAQLWRAWGIQPDAVAGHSLGEYVAACVAGAVELGDVLPLVAERGRLMADLPPGAMAAVSLPEAQVLEEVGRYGGLVSVAAVNGPGQVVVSGEPAAVREMMSALSARGVTITSLPARMALHSPMVEPMLPALRASLGTVRITDPKVPVVSTLTGKPLAPGQLADDGYWLRQLREPVRFAAAAAELGNLGCTVFLEIGPSRTLTALGARAAGDSIWLPSLQQGRDDWAVMLDSVAALYTRGVSPDWTAFESGYQRRRVTVPSYPFERQRYWIDPPSATDAMGPVSPALPALAPAASGTTDRTPAAVATHLREMAARILGVPPEDIDPLAPMTGTGLDSLSMIEVTDAIRREYGVGVTVRELITEVGTLADLADYVTGQLPPVPHTSPLPSVGETGQNEERGAGQESSLARPPANTATTAEFAADRVERLMMEQLRTLQDVITEQLRVIGRDRTPRAQPTPITAPADVSSTETPGPAATVAFRPLTVQHARKHGAELDEFITRYTERTRRSKELAAAYRRVHADNDNRFVPDFRMETKEIGYPIVADRSHGSRLWDVDGNEYIDLVMGMGVNLFGHSPQFITDAIADQLSKGMQIGVQNQLAGRTAELLCDLTSSERAVFCNTGSEAVMTALRLARAVTGRPKVAMFSGSYHGVFDGTLVRRQSGQDRPAPLAPGVPPHIVDDLIVVDYASPGALQVLARHEHELAAVLVEPVQSRRPDVAPREFLHELREFTTRAGTALIFDEMISGFRCDPGGAQAFFGVRADLAAYGKILGGGMPIGAVAGSSAFLDAIDGGVWQYGDDSYPRAATTFFAGTFCKHPLAMAAAHAVLTELRRQGPGLQRDLSARAERFTGELSEFFAAEEIPIAITRFGSLFRFTSPADIHLLYPHLIHAGVHAREGRNLFLSTAHSTADLSAVLASVREAVIQARRAGLLPGKAPGASAGRAAPAATRAVSSATEAAPTGPVPLTAGQRQLWTLAWLDPHAAIAYNQSAVLRIRGRLRLDALRTAVTTVVDRHEALRTVFDRAEPVQRVMPQASVEVQVTDLSADGTEFQDGDAHATLEAGAARELAIEADRPFDLAEGPLLRLRLLRLENDHHLLAVSAHHLIADGWSMGVLLQEIAACYSAACRGEAAGLPKPAQFRGYCDWLSERLANGQATDSERYWLERLHGPLPALDLAADLPRPPVRGFGGARLSTTVDASEYARLRGLCGQLQCTPFILLLAAYNVLLHRISEADDLVVGVPVAGRVFPGADRMVGYCANLVAIRTQPEPTMPFATYLKRVREAVLGAFEHQDYPFPILVERLGVRLDPARTPLVSTLFNMDHQVLRPSLDGLEVEQVTFPVRHAQFDLQLNAAEADGALRLEMDYSTELFTLETVSGWLGCFRTLLGAIADQPTAQLESLDLLTPRQQAELLATGSPVAESGAGNRCLQEVFDDQARRAPSAVCAIEGTRTLTYEELSRQAGQLAGHLRALGARPGAVVGVCLSRSLEAYVAIIGALKAGCAYLPLNPDLPGDRLAMLVADAGARLIVTDSGIGGQLPVTGATLVLLDADADEIAQAAVAGLPKGQPGGVAMVLYTSGSTARPKGVVITHRSVLSRLEWGWRVYPFASDEVSCHKTSLEFVDSVAELFGPLLRGVPSVIVSDQEVADSRVLLRTLIEARATRIVLVPSLLRMLVDAMAAGAPRPARLRLWTVSGEELPASLLGRFRMFFPEATVLNVYGSTEVMADATVFACPNTLDGLPRVPIGHAMDHARVYLLDRRNCPVPQGATGEVYIGGAGVATGYLGQPALTAGRFLPDPFAGRAGARMFRTGDLARLRPDGSLEYLGRRDGQVKIRGVRVEPGEVEAALEQFPGIAQAAVVAVPDSTGTVNLTAYVTPTEPSATVAEAGARRYLAARLRPHSVPAAVVALPALPRTASGKVDRQALRALGRPPADHPPARTGPRTPLERELSDIWSEVLTVQAQGIEDGFLDLGGNSLSAMQLLLRVSERLHVDLTLADLFEAPTIADQARLLEKKAFELAEDRRISELLPILEAMDEEQAQRLLDSPSAWPSWSPNDGSVSPKGAAE
jgi:amino acid adenylation domain-containing protein